MRHLAHQSSASRLGANNGIGLQTQSSNRRTTTTKICPYDGIAEQLRQIHIMEQVIERDPTCHHVIDMTTRPPRPDDIPGHFAYLPHDDEHVSRYLDRIENKELVQYAVHPDHRLSVW